MLVDQPITRFQILFFCPRPASSERINIGVIAANGEDRRAIFVSNWSRLEAFAGGDISRIKQLVKRLREEVHGQEPLKILDGEYGGFEFLKALDRNAPNQIGVTEPISSLASLDQLIPVIKRDFLFAKGQSAGSETGMMTRQSAAANAKRNLKKAIHSQFGNELNSFIDSNPRNIKGPSGIRHPSDLVIGNGTPVLSLMALSFRDPSTPHAITDASAALGTTVDLKEDGIIPAIFIAKPRRNSEAYRDILKGLADFGATVVQEGEESKFTELAKVAGDLVLSHS